MCHCSWINYENISCWIPCIVLDHTFIHQHYLGLLRLFVVLQSNGGFPQLEGPAAIEDQGGRPLPPGTHEETVTAPTVRRPVLLLGHHEVPEQSQSRIAPSYQITGPNYDKNVSFS